MSIEKRRRLRVKVELPVTIVDGGFHFTTQTKVLSLKGVLCHPSHEHFKDSQKCLIHFKLSDQIEIKIESRVVRTSDAGIALEFHRMDEESFTHLRKIMQLHSGDSDKIDKELMNPAFDDQT